jgi:glucose-6-phosphate dehydrogenase assembly protein OpcA
VIDATSNDSLPLDVRAIEAGLGQLWQLAAEGTVGGVVHASSLTLLVLLLDRGLADRQSALLAEVAPAHPCRVILVKVLDVEPRARLGAACRPASTGKPPSCWEEIRIEGSSAAMHRMMSVVGSLVLPNLPVQVWWPGDPDLGSQLFQRVLNIGDRIIIDSSQCREPLASLGQYAERMQPQHGTVGFADLAWARLRPWRMLTAQFFDPPEDRVFLRNVESVNVAYHRQTENGRGGMSAALLLVGWLASRLGWTIGADQRRVQRDGIDATFDDGGRSVKVQLRTAHGSPMNLGGDAARGVVSLRLKAARDGQSASYSIECGASDATTVAEVDGVRREAQLHLLPASEAELLRRELAGFGRDRIYEDALAVVTLMAQQAAKPLARV